MTNERIAFERWAATKGYDIDVMPAREPQNAGEYYDQTTQDSWVAWQARAAFPGESPAENSPVSKSAPEPARDPDDAPDTTAKFAELVADAERYRWMRQHYRYGGYEKHRLEWYLPRRYGHDIPPLEKQLDETVDEQRQVNRGEES